MGRYAGEPGEIRLTDAAQTAACLDQPRYPPSVYRNLVLDFYNATDCHREGYAAKRAS